MITFLYGRSGTGKSYTVTEEAGARLARGESVILLCPEQEAVIAEARMTDAFGGKIPTANLEILNFGRLPERVFRETGGLTVREIGAGGRRLLMHKTLTETAPLLREYGDAVTGNANGGDSALAEQLLSAVSECKMNCVTPADLEKAAGTLSRGSHAKLGDKVADMSLIYAVYEQYLHREYRDPEDMLTFLCEKFDETHGAFFRGKSIYLDGFNGFTAQQYRIIRHMFRYADNISVSLCCEPDGEREWMFRRVYDTEKNLFSILRDLGEKAEIRCLRQNRRAAHPALSHLTRNLWRMDAAPKEPAPMADGAVRVFSCETPFAEAEAVALDIRRYIMAGGRYRDITVITRSMERYEGILDIIFEKYEIPFYMARRSDLATKPLFRYLRHLSALVVYGMGRQDVIGILKTGFSGLDERDIFLFESYVTAWNLSGRAFTDGEEWNMNPAGYREEVTEDDIAALERVNFVKKTLADTLFAFCEEMRTPGETVEARAARLFSWLWNAHIPELLDARADAERNAGDITCADETAQIWSLFVGALDTLVTVSGGEVTDAGTFFSLFEMLISDLSVGTIPARCDEVTAGDAGTIRPDRAKRVYLVGCTDGAFPKTPVEDTLLSDFDKSILGGLGIPLSVGCAEQMQDELFLFWFACAAAGESLILSYPTADLQGKSYRPSTGVERIMMLFPDITPQNPLACDNIDRIVNAETAFECYAAERALQGDTRGERVPPSNLLRALEDTFRTSVQMNDDPAVRRRLDALNLPLTQRTNRLGEDTLGLLFGNTVAMTQSRLESYVLCHFAYFCGYVLKLREQKRVTFGTADIGSFVHYVLQRFMEQYAAAPACDREKYEDDAYLAETVGKLLSGYMTGVFGFHDGDSQPNRVRHLVGRLRQTATLIAKNLIHEFAASDFVPRDFELPVGDDRGGEGDDRRIAPLQITAPDGTHIRLYGTIDRVDTYEKDGATYVRVVDYKTYVKDFSLDDVAAGINMQMLLYLFAVWQNGQSRYGENLRPAGILYMAANPTEKTHNGIPTPAEVEAAAEKTMKRSGLFLDDRDVLEAMEHGLGGNYIPVRLKKDGSYRQGTQVETLEQFGALMHEVEATVCDIVTEMKSGNADAVPLSKTNPETGRDPCAYCKMRAVCRT